MKFWFNAVFTLILSGLTSTGPLPVAIANQETLRIDVDLVNVLFTVEDRKRGFVTALDENSFRVYENDRRESISNFSKESDLPLTVALLIDTSGSVRDKLMFERDAAVEFFKSTLRRRKDKGLLIAFDSGIDLVQDYTDDPDLLARSAGNVRSGGGTSLLDAMFLAATQKLANQPGRKVIILISDGDDNSSRTGIEETLRAVQQSDAVVYAISTNSAALGGTVESAHGDKMLKRFAEGTGGRVLFPRKLGDVTASFVSIGEELRSQYSIGYHSSNPQRDGTFRRIRIETTNKSLRVRARPGYYAGKAGK